MNGSRCTQCGAMYWPRVNRCQRCLGEEVAHASLSDTGELYSFSRVHVGQKGHAVPYTVAYVDLPEGLRVFGKMTTGSADPRVGSRVLLREVLVTDRPDAIEFEVIESADVKGDRRDA